MRIIGCDLHARQQTIAMLDSTTGEVVTMTLTHEGDSVREELQDLRSLLRHRHQWVRIRTRIQNALQSIALANGLRRGTSLWSQAGQHTIASLPSALHTAYPRSELQARYEKFEAEIEKLNQGVEEQALGRAGARLLMTHPGVGPVTALATEVFLGDPARFADSKALASYVGMIPREYSSGERQRLGGLSRQGNPLLRFLWGEAGAHAVRRSAFAMDFTCALIGY